MGGREKRVLVKQSNDRTCPSKTSTNRKGCQAPSLARTTQSGGPVDTQNCSRARGVWTTMALSPGSARTMPPILDVAPLGGRDGVRCFIETGHTRPPPSLITHTQRQPCALFSPDSFPVKSFAGAGAGDKRPYGGIANIRLMNCCNAKRLRTWHRAPGV